MYEATERNDRQITPTLRIITFGGFLLLEQHNGIWKELSDRDLSARGPSLTFLKVLVCSGPRMDSHRRSAVLAQDTWERHEVSRDILIDALWPEERTAPIAADRAVAVAKSVLNRALRNAAGGDVILLTDGSDKLGYQLSTHLVSIDADAFEMNVARASQAEGRGNYEQALQQWEAAYALVQGEFLPHDQYNDWSARRRERLSGKYRLCLHRLVRLYIEDGRMIEAVEKLHPYVLVHPADLDAVFMLLPLLAQQSRYEEAILLCNTCQQAMMDEGEHPPAALAEMVGSLRQAQEAVVVQVSQSLLAAPSKMPKVSSTIQQMPDAGMQARPAPVLPGKGDMEKNRREVFHLLSMAGAALALPFLDLDWERTLDAFVKPSHLDEIVLENLEAITHHFWSLYLAASTKSSVLEGVLGQLKTLVQFLRDSHPAWAHQRLCLLASETSQLVGELFFDMNDHNAAQSCYLFAAAAAKEGASYDLWSCALVRHAFLPLYRERHQEALSLLQQAHKLALRGDTLLPTPHWVAAVEAETCSGMQDLSSCQSALDRAQGVQDSKNTKPPWLRFDGSRLPALRGACYVRLGQPDLAMPALQEALQHFVKPDRKRGMALTDLAAAAIQSGNVEQARAYVDEVITILAQSSSDFLREELRALPRRVEPMAQTRAVQSIDAYIHQQLHLPV